MVLLQPGKPEPLVQAGVGDDHVLCCAAHGLAADAEPLAGKLPHSPVDEGHNLDGGLARADHQLRNPEKLEKAQLQQIATTMAIVIDKYTGFDSGPKDDWKTPA